MVVLTFDSIMFINIAADSWLIGWKFWRCTNWNIRFIISHEMMEVNRLMFLSRRWAVTFAVCMITFSQDNKDDRRSTSSMSGQYHQNKEQVNEKKIGQVYWTFMVYKNVISPILHFSMILYYETWTQNYYYISPSQMWKEIIFYSQ